MVAPTRILPFYIPYAPDKIQYLECLPTNIDNDGWNEVVLDLPKIPRTACEVLYDERFEVDNSSRWTFTTNYHTYNWNTVDKRLEIINGATNGYDVGYVNDITFTSNDGVIIEMDVYYGDAWGGITLNGALGGYVDCNPARYGPRHVESEYNATYGSGGTVIYTYKPEIHIKGNEWNRVAVVFIPPAYSPSGFGRWWVIINGVVYWAGEDFDGDFYATRPGFVTNYGANKTMYIGRFIVARFDPSQVTYVTRKEVSWNYKIKPYKFPR